MAKVDFKVSSGLKNIIGKELIIDDKIAVFELVKNAYDAYANNVRIIFKDTKNDSNAKFIIIDDGQGMSKEDIINKWLFVGFSDKKNFDSELAAAGGKISKGKRYLAGAKGIGRFSCDRLGTTLEMYTKKLGESNIHHLKVNWNKFEEDQNKEFQNIDANYEETKKIEIPDVHVDDFKSGTILYISQLNTRWDEIKLLKLKRFLQRLLNPYAPDATSDFRIYVYAEEYKEIDKSKGENEKINGLVKNTIFEELPPITTQINCSIQDGFIYTKLIDKGEQIFSIKEKNEVYTRLNNINIIIFYLNQSAKTAFTKLMGIPAVQYGSIFLYKNNFRIQPYGDVEDDWLELDKRKGQGYKRNLSTRELIGRIELNGAQPDFVEISSREGVQKDEAFSELKEFFKPKVLRPLERYVTEALNWDRNTGVVNSPEQTAANEINIINKIRGTIKDPDTELTVNPKLIEIIKARQPEQFPNIINNLEILESNVTNKKEKDYIKRQIRAIRLVAKETKEEKESLKTELEKRTKESLFATKQISPDKEIIINLNHTIETSSLTIEGYLDEINRAIIIGSSKIPIIIENLDKIAIEVKKIQILAGIVSVANFNLKAAVINKDIVEYIQGYLKLILTGKTQRIGVSFSGGDTKFVTKFRPLEIAIVMDNFISNSRKSGASLILITFKKIGESLFMYVADDGGGIKEGYEKNLFRRGKTTTSGAGIGLHHIKTIIEGMGGSVKFAGNNYENLAKGACFEVVFR